MAFFKDDADGDAALVMGKCLAERILTIGGKVKPGASKRWKTDFQHVIDKHGHNLVNAVLQEYCLRIQDENLPRIRSGKSFREHFDKMLTRTEAGIVATPVSADVEQLVRLIRLRWPFDDKGESAWLTVIYEEMKVDYHYFTKKEQSHLGPPKGLLNKWRIQSNSYAWATGSRSFADLWYGGRDDFFIMKIKREMV